MLQRTLPAGFIAPCLPSKTDKLPSSSEWLHEIKHDGFRVIARKRGAQVRLYSRPGNDLTYRFPLIVENAERPLAASLNNLVYECEQICRHIETECLGGLEIDG
jgi:ATP-dependent DNA ligase